MSTRQGTVYGPEQEQASQLNVAAEYHPSTANSFVEDDQFSCVSRSSQRTSSSVASIRAKARAEAAKTKLLFAKKQAKLMKQDAEKAALLETQKSQLIVNENTRKAHFEADMAVLQAEQEAAIATAEETVYETADLEGENQLQPGTVPNDSIQRTKDFVKIHAQMKQFAVDEEQPATTTLNRARPPCSTTPTFAQQPVMKAEPTPRQHFSQPHSAIQQVFLPQTSLPAPAGLTQHSGFTPTFSMHVPSTTRRQPLPATLEAPQQQQPDAFSTLTKHLMKRELISTCLLKFDDNPANFRAWKASFKSATEDLELTAAQELNLVMKWLGEKSSRTIAPLRAVNIENPQIGLQMVWETLEKRYGSAEVIEDNLLTRLETFPKFNTKDREKLQQLSYLLLEVRTEKDTGMYKGLAVLDSAKGLRKMVEKLPYPLQERWMRVGSSYKRENFAVFPPFEVFVNFIGMEADMRNDVSFITPTTNAEKLTSPKPFYNTVASTSKTTTVPSSGLQLVTDPAKTCIIHNASHALRDCRVFQKKPINERKHILMKNKICFKCCSSTTHQARDCKEPVQCLICSSERHISAMHIGFTRSPASRQENGGEDMAREAQHQEPQAATAVSNACTSVCKNIPGGRSCSKICKVEVLNDSNGKSSTVYAVIDDQSNSTLAKPALFDKLAVSGDAATYRMKTCAGEKFIKGRSTISLRIKSHDGKVVIKLPYVRECSNIPDNYSEIPVPDVAQAYPHLSSIIEKMEPVEPGVPIALLIGRDVLQAHKVREQIDGPENAPFAQRLDLGWVIIGESCLDAAAASNADSCQSHVTVSEDVFATSSADNVPANSIEDLQFMRILTTEAKKNAAGNWEMPIAMKRFQNVARRVQSKPKLAEQYQAFMQNMFASGHAEPAPPLKDGQEVFYLPFFEVFHPMKPDKIRIVYDSSDKFHGVSLNDVLLAGPDLNNSLLGVLIRFRKEPVAVMADIQQMFYNFYVREDHRDYLRFIWFEDNDLLKEPIDYRMNVHVFGNKPSPSVAIGLLAKAAEEGAAQYGKDAANFVKRNFYVDDGLISTATPEEAIDLLKRTKSMLSESNINLHKIASNSQKVMAAFNTEDLAKDLKDVDLSKDESPFQRSLGIAWNLKDDTFLVKVPSKEKQFTRRGLLSIVNSIYDPLGFVAPVTLEGRLLVRELTTGTVKWDDPIEDEKKVKWNAWVSSIEALNNLMLPRCYTDSSLETATRMEMAIFCDASVVAIGAVCYLRVFYGTVCKTGFVMAKSRVAPKPAHTIPRLELCAAVLAVEMAETINKEIDIPLQETMFYTDSNVVLGYINNTSRRFYTYVANRVNRIRQSTSPTQWHYVNTADNPADLASRPSSASNLKTSNWFEGPAFLKQNPESSKEEVNQEFDLVEPAADSEVRPEPSVFKTALQPHGLGSHRFERFSNWRRLCKTIASLIQVARGFQNGGKGGWKQFSLQPDTGTLQSASHVIFATVQRESYSQELKCLQNSQHIEKGNAIRSLAPFIGRDGLIRVGGRCEQQDVPYNQRHPIVLPQNRHITDMVAHWYHEHTKHQGRRLTEGAIRSAGFWITGSKGLVSSLIRNCVICRRLRGITTNQKMADLPADRITPCPPFTSVGLDVFGPWEVTARKTRGGFANSKRWAVMFTCMYSRAVHIEVLETLTTSSLINALRRFFAFRGPAKILRSDQGTNFIGAANELKLIAENKDVKQLLQTRNCTWILNPPKAPHMGGTWERMIGVAKKILNSILSKQQRLTHEVLTTVLCEAMEIINSRPLVEVSTDPDSPTVLSPATLLTQKFDTMSAPEGNFQQTSYDAKDHWKLVQSLANMFAEKWKQEYLTSLTSRTKWQQERPNIQVGDVVLLVDEQQKRSAWPLAKVVEAPESNDGKVRKVKLKVVRENETKEYLRPVTKVIPLLSEKE